MSYLGLVRRLENQHTEYREALRRYWSSPEDTEAYQQLLLLLDDLGVLRASVIRLEEQQACDHARARDVA